MKVLLVEPFYEREYLPLPLMKIARYHKNNGDEIVYKRGEAGFDSSYNPDVIYITSLFTWDFDIVVNTIWSYKKLFPNASLLCGGVCVSLMIDKFEEIFKDQNIYFHKGLHKDFENQLPYYDIFPETDYFIGFTSRGCPRRCGFCMVHKHEPDFIEDNDFLKNIIDWEIAHKKEKIILWDNNILASSDEHFDFVMDRLSALTRFKIDFNQAIDARLMTDEKASKMKKVNWEVIRFAFDGMHEDGFVQNAIKSIRNAGITCEIRNYVLYNFTDKPEDLYYRLSEIAKLYCVSFPMKYQPLNVTKKGDFVSTTWKKEWIENFNRMRSSFYMNGVIVCNENTPENERSYSLKNFYKVFGNNADEFKDKLIRGIILNPIEVKQNSLFKYIA